MFLLSKRGPQTVTPCLTVAVGLTIVFIPQIFHHTMFETNILNDPPHDLDYYKVKVAHYLWSVLVSHRVLNFTAYNAL